MTDKDLKCGQSFTVRSVGSLLFMYSLVSSRTDEVEDSKVQITMFQNLSEK